MTTLRTTLQPASSSPARARAFVTSALTTWDADALIPTATLLTSELVTNAYLHAHTGIELRLVRTDAGVRFEVFDASPQDPAAPSGGRARVPRPWPPPRRPARRVVGRRAREPPRQDRLVRAGSLTATWSRLLGRRRHRGVPFARFVTMCGGARTIRGPVRRAGRTCHDACASSGEQSVNENEIRLVLPAQPEYARIARLAVAGLATRLGFTYDEVEDLRIAVGEACSVLVSDAGRGPARAGVRDARPRPARSPPRPTAGPAPEVNDLTEQILDAVVDEHEIDPAQRQVVLVKHRQT